MNRWSGDPTDWYEGDPILDTPAMHPDDRREDSCFVTISEVAPERRSFHLDAFQRDGCLSARGRRDIEAIMGMGRCES